MIRPYAWLSRGIHSGFRRSLCPGMLLLTVWVFGAGLNAAPASESTGPSGVVSAVSSDHPVAEIELWMELALRHNPDLVRLRAEADVAEAQAQTAEGWTDPELRLGWGRGDRTVDRTWWGPNPDWDPQAPDGNPPFQSGRVPTARIEESDRAQVALRISPPHPVLTAARNSANRALAQAARSDFQVAAWQIYGELKAALLERDGAERGMELTMRLIDIRRTVLAATRELVTAGQMTVVDQMAAQQQVFQATQQNERQLARKQAAEHALYALSGFASPPPREALRQEPEPLPPPESLNVADLENRAFVHRGEMMAAQWRTRAAAASLREARSARMPWFSFLEASYARTRTRDDTQGSLRLASVDPGEADEPLNYMSLDDEAESEWRIEAGITLPVFSLGPRATRVALAGQRAARAGEAQIAAQVAGEVRSAYQDYVAHLNRLADVRRDIQNQEEQIQAHQKRMTGHAEISRLDEARMQEALADMALLRNEIDQAGRQALLRLEAAVGENL